MSTSLVVLLLLSNLQLVRVAAFSLSISPEHVRTSNRPESVTFTCSADTALTGCQISRWDLWGGAGPLLELSQGFKSQANSTHLGATLTSYIYSGRGLGAGDCGVSLQVEGRKTWMAACRVRTKTGGWTYAWADWFAHIWEHFPNTRTPRESVVVPGGEARFTLKAQEQLSQCYFHPPGLGLFFDQGAQSPNSTGRYRYLGGGLENGECGLAVTNVSEVDNGPVASYIGNAARTKSDYRFMALIVARPPGAPSLSVVYTDAGVTATCVVHEGRPVANITWVLGDAVIRQDLLDDHPGNAQDEWRWPWMQGSILQKFTLRLQAEDNGKVLKCVASHVALARPLEATEIISFTEPLSPTARAAVQTTTTAPSPCTCPNASLGASPDRTRTAISMLGLLCQEYSLRASQLENISCPRDEAYEFCVREARAAARTAELAEDQAQVALEAAKADAETKAVLAKLAEDQTKVALEVAKADAETKAVLAKLAEYQAKVALEAAKADAETKAVLAKVALEAEEARARKEVAWAKNAEEELQFERERRSQGLHQPQSPQSAQGLGQQSAVP